MPGQRPNLPHRAVQVKQAAAGGRIPDSHRAIVTGRSKAPSGRIATDTLHFSRVAAQRAVIPVAERQEIIPFPPAKVGLGTLGDVPPEPIQYCANLARLPVVVGDPDVREIEVLLGQLTCLLLFRGFR